MADINLTQVIHNVKEAYVDLTGDTDDITYGNISTKISEIQTGGGNIGYQVTFKVDGNDYYIASCQQGESITEPPTPTGEFGYLFIGWQLNGTYISFPYTPSADVTLLPRWVAIPQDYTVLNYIQTTGTQYINTDIKPYDYGGLGIIVNNFTPFSYSGIYGTKFFSVSDEVTSGSHSSGLSVGSNKLRLDFNAQNLEFTHSFTYGNSYKIECGYSQALHYAYAKMDDNIEVQNTQLNYVAANAKFQILGAFMDDSTYKFPCNARFGETIITTPPTTANTLEGTAKLRHFFPCLDNNQVPCMYDVITETTYYNAGTGTFLYG